MKLYAVRIFVRNWNESCSFYRDTLELPERFRDDNVGWAEYDLGGPCIGLERAESDDAGTRALVGRFVGLSLQVEDIGASYRELESRGVKFTAPLEKQAWGGSLAFFEDPDGNVLTLLG